jgi:hypothetical protein
VKRGTFHTPRTGIFGAPQIKTSVARETLSRKRRLRLIRTRIDRDHHGGVCRSICPRSVDRRSVPAARLTARVSMDGPDDTAAQGADKNRFVSGEFEAHFDDAEAARAAARDARAVGFVVNPPREGAEGWLIAGRRTLRFPCDERDRYASRFQTIARHHGGTFDRFAEDPPRTDTHPRAGDNREELDDDQTTADSGEDGTRASGQRAPRT